MSAFYNERDPYAAQWLRQPDRSRPPSSGHRRRKGYARNQVALMLSVAARIRRAIDAHNLNGEAA